MSSRAISGRAARWLTGGLRVSVAGTFVLVAFGVVAVRISVARAADVGMTFGDQLMFVGETHASGNVDAEVYHVKFNGQTVDSTNASSPLPMREILDYAATQCKEHADGLRDAFQHLGRSLATKAPTGGGPGALVVHEEYAERGFVFCVSPDHPLTEMELLGRMRDVAETGDFNRVGAMRYLAVRRVGHTSKVVTAWTDGAFEFAKMFPDTGDVPGDDFVGVPRPDGARRTISATVVGAPAGVNAYAVQGKVNDVLAGVDTKLIAAGWASVPTARGVPNAGKYYTLRSKEDLVVTASDGSDGTTSIGYVVSRGIGSTSR